MTTRARQSITSLFRDAGVYGLSRVAAIFVSVLLVPIYTRQFTVEEYGRIENLNVLAVMLIMLFGAGLPESITRFYTVAETAEARRRIVTSATVATGALGLLAIVVLVAMSPWLGQRLIKTTASSDSTLLLLLVGIYVLGTLPLTVVQTLFQARFARAEYVVTTLGLLVVSTTVALVCVVGFGFGIAGLFLGSAVGAVVFATYGLIKIRREVGLRTLGGGQMRELMHYGLSFVPAGFALLVIRSSDRYFITAMLPDSLHQVGLYVTAEKIMLPINVVASALMIAWAPFSMRASLQENSRDLYIRVFRYYVVLTSAAVIVLSGLSPLLLKILTTPPYYPAYVYTPVLGTYLALNSLYYIGSTGLLLSRKTKLLVPVIVGSAGANVVLNFALIPSYGVFGAAAATVLAFLILNVLTFLVAERQHYVGYPLWRGLAAYATACGAGLALVYDPAIGIGASAVHVGYLVAAGLARPADATIALTSVRAALSSLRNRLQPGSAAPRKTL